MTRDSHSSTITNILIFQIKDALTVLRQQSFLTGKDYSGVNKAAAKGQREDETPKVVCKGRTAAIKRRLQHRAIGNLPASDRAFVPLGSQTKTNHFSAVFSAAPNRAPSPSFTSPAESLSSFLTACFSHTPSWKWT